MIMKKRLYILAIAIFMICNNVSAIYELASDTTGYIPSTDTTAVVPPAPEIPDTSDVIPPNVPDTGTVVPPPAEPSAPSIEGRKVVEYPHVVASGKKQQMSLSLEGNNLRVKGQIWAQGTKEHYLDYQIMADSAYICRVDMDYKNTKAYLLDIDVLIPGFAGDKYKVTFEALDVSLSATDEAKQRKTMLIERGNSAVQPVIGNTFLIDGRTWNYKQTTFDMTIYNIVEKFFSLTIKGETTFRDVPCREIYHTENGKSSLYGYAYEDGAKVYFYFLKDIENLCSPSTDWELIFDFDKKETEIFNASFPAYLVAKDTIEVKGNTYQRYWIGPQLEPKFKSEIIKFYPIVHSIGGYAGLHNNTFERTGKSPSYSCESVYDGDECIFEKKDFCADAINSEYDKYLKGKRWNYSHSSYMQVFGDNKKNFSLRRHHPYSLAINGDTVVAGRSCKKIYYINKYTEYSFQINEVLQDTLFVPNNDVILHGYMHETKDSVSFYIEKEIAGVESPDADGKWRKMYDFTVPSGTYCDWMENLSMHGFYMLDKEDVEIGGQTYTAYLLYGDKMSSLQGTFAVIPGIGCDGLFFSTPRFGTSTFSLYFSSVYDGDNCLWNRKNQNELFDKYFGKYAAVRLGNEPMENQFDYNHNHVTHLWVWGTPQAADYEYLKTERLAGLELLDMRNADIDTIPSRAFYTTISNNKRIILPKTLKHLADSALCSKSYLYMGTNDYELIFELTSPTFPTLGKDVYAEKLENQDYVTMPIIVPSADNKAFVCHENVLYSADGNIAYYSNMQFIDPDRATPRIINANLLENGYILGDFYIPATVDSIGNRAFANVGLILYTGKGFTELLACYATIPPKLGKDVFVNSCISKGLPVYVPENSFELYSSAEGWRDLNLRTFSGKGLTAIEDITSKNQTKPTFFDLQGRKVKNPTKGLYIKEGKKVFVE